MIVFKIFMIILMAIAFAGIAVTPYLMSSKNVKYIKVAVIIYAISAVVGQGVTIGFAILVLHAW